MKEFTFGKTAISTRVLSPTTTSRVGVSTSTNRATGLKELWKCGREKVTELTSGKVEIGLKIFFWGPQVN